MNYNDARIEILYAELREIRLKTLGYRVVLYLAAAALILTKFYIAPTKERALTADDVTCRKNLRAIGKALDRFAASHQKQYPTVGTEAQPLQELTPQFLSRLPVCPTNGADYGARFGPGGQWNPSGAENYYHVWCRGDHPGNPPGFPWFDSSFGLVGSPLEIERPTYEH